MRLWPLDGWVLRVGMRTLGRGLIGKGLCLLVGRISHLAFHIGGLNAESVSCHNKAHISRKPRDY